MACPTTATPYGLALVVSSTTRPTTPPDLTAGRVIFEADTLRTLVYDGAGWVIMSEPWQTFASAMTAGAGALTTVATTSFRYKRDDGTLFFEAAYSITANGTGSSFLQATLPVTPNASWNSIGFGREPGVSGSMLVAQRGGTGMQIVTYNNTYPGANNATPNITGFYEMTSRYS